MLATEVAVPAEWSAALEAAAPDDFVIRLSIVDWLLERDRAVEADGWLWTVEKRRWTPWDVFYRVESICVWNYNSVLTKSATLPRPLFNRLPGVDSRNPATPTAALQRLVRAWAAATDSERQAAWAWQPPQ